MKMKAGMSLLRVTLNVSLLFGVMCLFIHETTGNGCDLLVKNDLIIYDVVPALYEINLTLNLQTDGAITFSGNSNIFIFIHESTQNISLHAEKPYVEVTNVTLQKIKSGDFYNVRELTYNSEDQTLTIHFTEVLLCGRFLLKMMFNGLANDDDEQFFKIAYTYMPVKLWLVVTDLRSVGARRLFPCWDDTKLKSIFKVVIRYKSDQYIALTSTPLYRSYISDGIHLLFKDTPLISTRDISIVMFDKKILTKHRSSPDIEQNVPDIWHRSDILHRHIAFAIKTVEQITQYLVLNWETYKKHVHITYVMIPAFRYEIMKNFGLVCLREQSLLHINDHDDFGNQLKVARFAAQVLISDWFVELNNHEIEGNNLWIHDGISILLAVHIINKTHPVSRMLDLFVVREQQESLYLHSIFKLPSKDDGIRSNRSSFPFSYFIAPILLRTLQFVVTDKIFWGGIKLYLKSSPENKQDFYHSMEYVYNTQTKQENRHVSNIEEIMNVWESLKHVPILKVNSTKFPLIEVEIENIRELGNYNLRLPITIITQSKSNFMPQQRLFDWVTTHSYVVKLNHSLSPINDWVIVNLQQIGYYRVRYDLKNWRKLVKYLNSEKYSGINVLNRAQLIDDAFYFLKENQIYLSIFIDFVKYLRQETDYIAWYPMFKIFERLSPFYPFKESKHIKETMKTILDQILFKIKYEEAYDHNNLNSSLKQEAARWACFFGSSNCRDQAMHNLHTTITNIPVLWKEWAYCKGLMAATYQIWKREFDKYEVGTNNQISKYLVCAEDPYVIRNYTKLITDNENIKKHIMKKGEKEHIYIFHSIIERHAKTALVLTYILDRLQAVKPRQISTTVALIGIINYVHSDENLDKLREYIQKHKTGKIKSLLLKRIAKRSYQIEIQRTNFRYLL